MATFLEATELDGDEVVVGAAPLPYEFDARPLTLAERYALWGGLRSTNSLQTPLALGDAESAIRADPTAPHGYGLRGRLRLATNDLPGAIADYRAASARERQGHEHPRALAFLQLERDGLRSGAPFRYNASP